LAGLTSRWTRPASCAASSAEPTCSTSFRRRARLQAPVAPQAQAQILAADVPHGEVEHVVVLAGVVDRDDVGVVQGRRDLGLGGEPAAERFVAGELGSQELERDGALQGDVRGAVDDTHPAAPDELVDAVSGERRADEGIRHTAFILLSGPR
jgi:hypothetical protein